MTCPRCSTRTEIRNHADIDVPTCPACGGMFLRHGALNEISGPEVGDVEFSTLHQDSFRHEDDHGPISCPECADSPTMAKVEFNIYTNIILDYCNSCRGFWLDSGEADRIHEEVRRLDEADNESPAPAMRWFAEFIWGLPR